MKTDHYIHQSRFGTFVCYNIKFFGRRHVNWIQNTPDPYRFFQQIIQKDVVHNMDTYITREIKAFNLTAFSLSQLRNGVNTARHSC